MAIKIKIKENREKLCLSVADISKITGISKSYLYDIERGRVTPTVVVVCKIAKAMGLSLEDLVECDSI